jgi:hypothetical protein
MAIFNSYVKLPEGIPKQSKREVKLTNKVLSGYNQNPADQIASTATIPGSTSS